MLRFIGFGHRHRMGKDAAGHELKKIINKIYPNLVVECRAFADPIYEIGHKLYGWDDFQTKEFYDTNPEYKTVPLAHVGKTPREILIDIGTPAFRNNVWKNTWTEYLMHICSRHENRLVLVTDVRFQNELDIIHREGGFCIKVTRHGVPLSDDVADSALDGVPFDLEIWNDGTLEDLGKKALEAVQTLLRRNIEDWVIQAEA